ncbi:hypothetical protein Tco_1277975 [Tanacetum coccineum]
MAYLTAFRRTALAFFASSRRISFVSHGALDLGFKVLWSKNEGTDEVLEGTAQEYESTAGANLSTAEVYESTAHSLFKVLNAHIRYHLKELRYCAQCLIIENEDFVKRSRDHYIEPTEFEIQEMVNIWVSGEAYCLNVFHLHAPLEGKCLQVAYLLKTPIG